MENILTIVVILIGIYFALYILYLAGYVLQKIVRGIFRLIRKNSKHSAPENT